MADAATLIWLQYPTKVSKLVDAKYSYRLLYLSKSPVQLPTHSPRGLVLPLNTYESITGSKVELAISPALGPQLLSMLYVPIASASKHPYSLPRSTS
ncbi:hypothetical protein G9A89_000243 [Geosiphon pyriformis]|nr:hypothetical protein G9A89_000243 [Geosiphon pyriformis]